MDSSYQAQQSRQRYWCDFSKWPENLQQRMSKLLGPLDRKMRHHESYIEKNPQNLENRPIQLPEKDAKKIFRVLGVTTHLAVSWGRSVLRTFRVWKANVRAQNKRINVAKQLAEQEAQLAEQEAISTCGFFSCSKCGTLTQGTLEAEQHEEHCQRRKSKKKGEECGFCIQLPQANNFTLRSNETYAAHCRTAKSQHVHPSAEDLLCEKCDKYYDPTKKTNKHKCQVEVNATDMWVCVECQLVPRRTHLFTNVRDFKAHNQLYHNEE